MAEIEEDCEKMQWGAAKWKWGDDFWATFEEVANSHATQRDKEAQVRKLAASRKRKERQIVATRKRVKAATLHSQPIGAFLDRASAPRVEPPLTDETAEEVGRMHNFWALEPADYCLGPNMPQ